MNVIEFLEYLAGSESTRELAYALADVWVADETAPAALEPAA